MMRDGSVLFWKGGLLVGPIYRQTNSLLTHVAIILGGAVYEAAPPCVHSLKFGDYEKHLDKLAASRFIQRRGFSWFILQPRLEYTASELAAMRTYAISQLGRPYRLRGWWSDDVRGIFCSQYVGNIIEKTSLIKSFGNKESPISLYNKLSLFYS
jgi:hypothetical protein